MDDRRTVPDRRSQPRREAELRLHLARELVLTKARQLVGVMNTGDGSVGHQLTDLAELVAVLNDAEALA